MAQKSPLDGGERERYTLHMKQAQIISHTHSRLILALLPVLSLLGILALAACSAGSLGNEGIAFVRDGNLWTIDPGGQNAFEVVSQSTPVLGYGLSPDHQIFTFRTLDESIARSQAGKRLAVNPLTGLAGDLPSTLNTLGIDGGSPISLILSSPGLARSNAWWTPDGTHLLYREGASANLSAPDLVTWWISQNDQPLGIARKFLPYSFSIPSISSDSSLAIENSPTGLFTSNLAGTNLLKLQATLLVGHPLPASLERVLWQPVQQHPAVLYAVRSTKQSGGGKNAIELLLRTSSGQVQQLAQCDCRQFAWAPDGQHVLYSTSQGYTVLDLQSSASFSFATEHGAVPYWSPNSTALLMDGTHTLTLVNIATQQTRTLLSDGREPVMTDAPLPGSVAFLQPVENSLWNIDGKRLVFSTRGRTLWEGEELAPGNGLYTLTLNSQGQPQGVPVSVDANTHDTQPGWSYENPDTSFLF